MDEAVKYLMPIIGVIVGASLQFFFSRKDENFKRQTLLKMDAYKDFLKAVATIDTINFRFNSGKIPK